MGVVFNWVRGLYSGFLALWGKVPRIVRWVLVLFGLVLNSFLVGLPFVALFGFETVSSVLVSDPTQALVFCQPIFSVISVLIVCWFISRLWKVPVLSSLENDHLSFFGEDSESGIPSSRLFGILLLGTVFVSFFVCFSDYLIGVSGYGQVDSWAYIFSLFPSSVVSTCINAVFVMYLYRLLRLMLLWVMFRISVCSSFLDTAKGNRRLSWLFYGFFVVLWSVYLMFSYYAGTASHVTPLMIPYLVSNFILVPVLWCTGMRVRRSTGWVLFVAGLYSVLYFVFAVLSTAVIHQFS